MKYYGIDSLLDTTGLNWDAKRISTAAANYLAHCSRKYAYEELSAAERESYGNNQIELAHYLTFQSFAEIKTSDIHKRWEVATELVSRQHELWMDKLVAVDRVDSRTAL